jgi:hypothetical protein
VNLRYGSGVKEMSFSNATIPPESVKIKKAIEDGMVTILREAVPVAALRASIEALREVPLAIVDHPLIVEGAPNSVHQSRVTEQTGRRPHTYEAVDTSWYVYPWNKDESGLWELLKPAMRVVAECNGYDFEHLESLTPRAGTVLRLQVIEYPLGAGYISKHVDPVVVARANAAVYVTEFDVNYSSGGFYVYFSESNKVAIDPLVRSGDLVLFAPNLVHGVDVVDAEKILPIDSSCFLGRVLILIAVVQSHEREDRIPAIGIA